jgi:hypothetical protein
LECQKKSGIKKSSKKTGKKFERKKDKNNN